MTGLQFVTLVAIYAAISSSGLTLIKAGSTTMELAVRGGMLQARIGWQPIAGVLLYALSFLLGMYILTRAPLAVAFPVISGASFALVIAMSSLILHEPVGAAELVGAALILGGIIIIRI